MFGLLLRSIQAYVRSTFEVAVWGRILRAAGQSPEGFEPMLPYDQTVLDAVLSACSTELSRPAEVILEDVGTFLVADPNNNAVRRLLRFGGANFEEFLMSLDELPDRGKLAFPGLDVPQIGVVSAGGGHFRLTLAEGLSALFPVLTGAVRAMADDYGVLALIDAEGNNKLLTVQLLATTHGHGRRFDLAPAEVADGR